MLARRGDWISQLRFLSKSYPLSLFVACLILFSTETALSQVAPIAGEPTWARLANSAEEPQNWLTYFGNNRAWSYSSLDQITHTNVGDLVPVWTFAAGDAQMGLVATPLVMEGIMYL